MSAPVELKRDGQPFFDRPVYAQPKDELMHPIRLGVSAVFNGGRPEVPRRITLGHERVRLRWMKRDRDGNLVPRREG